MASKQLQSSADFYFHLPLFSAVNGQGEQRQDAGLKHFPSPGKIQSTPALLPVNASCRRSSLTAHERAAFW